MLEQDRRLSEEENIRAWRLLELLRAGYDIASAEAVAQSDADLHYAFDLVHERGCPPATAAAILT